MPAKKIIKIIKTINWLRLLLQACILAFIAAIKMGFVVI